MTLSHYMAMADLEVMERRPSVFMGMTDPRIASLRCFKFYSRDAGTILTAPDGRERWMGPKAARIYAVAHRDAGKHTTMLAIAQEVMCAPSTVSRALTKLQAFGFIAVDVKRGRNGGITVQIRKAGDALKHYASAAWRRIRSWINVASRSFSEDVNVKSTSLSKDATFTEGRHECTIAPYHGPDGTVLDCSSFDHTPLAPSETYRRALDERARALDFARRTIAEIRRLDDEPDWDLELEKYRASYGFPSAF